MILSDCTIQKMLEQGRLSIHPLEEGQIQPASVDIRLGNTFSIVEDTSGGIIDLEKELPCCFYLCNLPRKPQHP